ncbi:MAG TPA: MBL fold metallo-hydrolase [Vicinamibacterales bacterium]|jgi:glyoxylase-like metal-dependent hydrolase (beta-lactamase superfamily II)
MSARIRGILVCASLAAALGAPVLAQDWDKLPVRTVKVTDQISMLIGAGANIGVSIGADGVLLVDNGFVQQSAKVKAAVAALDPRPVKIALNTNWHIDHADSNGVFAAGGAVVMAHRKSRPHMLVEQRITELDPALVVPPCKPEALPAVTITEPTTIYFNGDEIAVIHVPTAHSDGDLAYYFRKANVLFTGDLLFPTSIPFIHFTGGGTVAGMIRAADRILTVVNDQTKIIPGHGPVSAIADVRAARELLITVRDRIQALVNAGRTAEEVVAANPLQDLYKRRESVPPERFARLVYEDLKKVGRK